MNLSFAVRGMSLDVYVAGPDMSVDHPLGVGGERLRVPRA